MRVDERFPKRPLGHAVARDQGCMLAREFGASRRCSHRGA